jgi:hypothetical protein
MTRNLLRRERQIVILQLRMILKKRGVMRFLTVTAAFAAMASPQAFADEPRNFDLVLENNAFSPQKLTIPAQEKVKVTVKNQDATPAEFESYDLNREKVVGGKSQIVVYLGPLEPGHYSFFDDFHRDTTTGTLIVE